MIRSLEEEQAIYARIGEHLKGTGVGVTPSERNAAVIVLRDLLQFRLPASGLPLTTIVLSRANGEALLEEITELRKSVLDAGMANRL